MSNALSFDNNYLAELLARLVDIPSVYPHEKEILLFLEAELARLGFTTQRYPVEDDRWNILVRIGEDSPVLCLNSHCDTVQPAGNSVPKSWIEGDTLFGLGSMDDKASVTAMIGAMKAIADSGVALNGTLDLLLSVDEEGDARGVRTAIPQGYRCDMTITGEGTDLAIVPAHCGLVFLEIVTHGKATHGALPMEGVNAIERMFQLVTELREAVTDHPPHPTVGPPTLNLGILRGGDRPNRVPDRCEASVDIRLVPPMTVKWVLDRVRDVFAGWGDTAEYKIIKQGEALDTPPDSPLIGAIRSVTERVLGHSTESVGWRGWTEAEAFQSGLGIDAVVFGPGELIRAHSANEFVSLAQVHQAARLYAEIALEILH
jgi:acetylornithine deacetylase/succinyl-diaminopimelate desuccinylase-like protein